MTDYANDICSNFIGGIVGLAVAGILLPIICCVRPRLEVGCPGVPSSAPLTSANCACADTNSSQCPCVYVGTRYFRELAMEQKGLRVPPDKAYVYSYD